MTLNSDLNEDFVLATPVRYLAGAVLCIAAAVVGCSSADDNGKGAASNGSTGGSANGTSGAGGDTAGGGTGSSSTGGSMSSSAGGSMSSSAGGSMSSSAGGSSSTGKEPKIPPMPDSCPMLATGMVTVLGQQVQLWVGAKQADKKGAVMFYWHGTGGNSAEASRLGPALTEIQSEGGIVASFSTSLKTGTTTGNNVWYVDDFKMADVILACAIQQLNIDTHRIYSAGCSAGGLQSGSMAFSRSSYLAAAMCNSGGSIFVSTFEDTSHIPSVITAHGGTADKVIIAFADTSKAECNAISMAGGFAMDCDHGGGHCGAPADLVAAQWQYLKDHPFGISADPYAAGIPPSFPMYCTKY